MQTIIWDFLFLILFGLSIYLFLKTPLRKRWTAPAWVDPVLGFTFTLFIVVYFYFVHYAVNLIPESDFAPCGRFSKQIECYSLSQETCSSVWHSSMGDCSDQLESVRRQRPTALMGSFLETCIGRNFDKVMHYNRKNLESPSCQIYFKKMDQKD